MKKIYLSVLLMAVAITYAPAQEAVVQSPATCEFVPVTHWSLGIKGGANYFIVTPFAVKRTDQIHLMFGGSLEYTINPLVGIGLEYNYNPYSHSYYLNGSPTGDMVGSTHDAVMYSSINFSNLLTPYRAGFFSKLNIYGDAGVGFGFYNFSLNDAPKSNAVSPMAKVGLNAEYNISKSVSLGVEGQYRYYHRNNLGGIDIGATNEALTTTIGLRYKFAANGDKQHARNISICEYYPKPVPVVIEKESKEDNAEILERLNAIEEENAALKTKLQKLDDDLKTLSMQDKGVVNASFQNVEFEFASDQLTEDSYSTLDQIAIILINNPTWAKLNVAGHTDSIGTSEFNQTLSEARANSVKNYLLNKNVPDSSVIVTGYGEDKPIASNDTEEGRQKNRRVEFQITK